MKKIFKPEPPPVSKAMIQLIDAFCDTYKPVAYEEEADEVFTVRRLREYFNAWPLPKTPDPLPPYMNELERRGFAMQTSYDGQPGLFCLRWQIRGEVCTVQEEAEPQQRTGLTSIQQLINRRIKERRTLHPEEDDEEE